MSSNILEKSNPFALPRVMFATELMPGNLGGERGGFCSIYDHVFVAQVAQSKKKPSIS
jgi:hypothetical protein